MIFSLSRIPGALLGEARFSLLFAGLFLALGAQMAFAQLWLEDWGLSAAEIGAVNALAMAVRIGAGVAAPALSDRLKRPRAFMTALALAGALGAALHLLAADRLQIYALAMLLSVVYAGLIPLTDAHGYAAAEAHGFSYRRARSVGSFAFLAATLLAGVVVEAVGVVAVPIWIALSLLLTGAAAAGAPLAPATDAPPPLWRGLGVFMRDRAFVLFLLAIAAINASHAVYYVYGSIHWRALGYSETLIGALWAWGVLAEIGLFFIGRTIMERLGPVSALMLATTAAIARWALTSLDPALGWLIALQALHALTFALMHLASLAYIAETTPTGSRATAQGLMSATAGGLGMLPATTLAAWAFPAFGGGAYLLGAVCGVIGLVAVWALLLERRTRADLGGTPDAALTATGIARGAPDARG